MEKKKKSNRRVAIVRLHETPLQCLHYCCIASDRLVLYFTDNHRCSIAVFCMDVMEEGKREVCRLSEITYNLVHSGSLEISVLYQRLSP